MRLALRGDATPRVFQVPGPLHLEHAVPRQLDLRTATAKDSWIASCTYTYDLYRKHGVDERRLFLSRYGTDLSLFDPGRPTRLRAELRVSACEPLVGMVAYMYAPKRYLGHTRGLKGHEDFIDAVGIAARQIPELRAVVIGGAWDGASAYERRLRARARRVCGDRIAFLGTRADVASLYPDLDVAIHPSLSENVGGAAESRLFGVPTICTAVGGFPDLIRHGQTGWLVPPRDPARLAQMMVEVLRMSDQGRGSAERGRDVARQLMDVTRTSREVIAIYDQVLARAAGRAEDAPRGAALGGRSR